MARTWTIIGCGYVGERLARKLLARGTPVVATRRSEEACAALRVRLPGARVDRFSLGDEGLAWPDEGVLVLSAPPSAESPAPEAALAAALAPAVRLIYLSTTGVYAPGHGAEVADEYEASPISERGQRRLDVERAIAAVRGEWVALRIPGIYGPGRGAHQRMKKGNYRLIGAADTAVSRIHVDDLVDGILLLGDRAQLPHHEIVIGDEEPTSPRLHALGIAERLGLPPPPTVDPATVPASVRAMLGADRRIVPRRLRDLGWRPRYRSWREGLEQALEEEEQEGE